jgi:hypothetical protein
MSVHKNERIVGLFRETCDAPWPGEDLLTRIRPKPVS